MRDHTVNMSLLLVLASLFVLTQQPGQLVQVLSLALAMAVIWAVVLAPVALIGKARQWCTAVPVVVTQPKDFSWFLD